MNASTTPRNLDAEQAVLGACILDGRALPIARALFGDSPDLFETDAHHPIWQAMMRLLDAGKPIDPVTLKAELEGVGDLVRVGGMAYIAELSGAVPDACCIEHYAEIVIESRRKRAQAFVVEQASHALQNGHSSAEVADLLRPACDVKRAEPLDIVCRSFADIVPERLSWLWPGRIPRGKLTMIAGHPGLGKSQLTIYIASAVTTGKPFHESDEVREPGNVVFLSAEDDPADTIRPRLDAAGADPKRVFFVDGTRDHSGDRMFSLERDVPRLAALGDRYGEIQLIVIDPVSAYMGRTDTHKNADVRSVLAPLSKLAEETGAAIVCVTHLNKSAMPLAMQRFTGSGAFVAAARAAFLVAPDPDEPERRFFLPVKNNLGPNVQALAFRLEQKHLPDALVSSAIQWEPGEVAWTADDVMAAEAGRRSASAFEKAREFLLHKLDEGPVPAATVEADATAVGISGATLKRAKRKLGITSKKSDYNGAWQWELLGRGSADCEGDHVDHVPQS